MQPNESPCWPSLLFLFYFTDFYSYYPSSICLGLFYPDFYSSLKLFIHYNNISFIYIYIWSINYNIHEILSTNWKNKR